MLLGLHQNIKPMKLPHILLLACITSFISLNAQHKGNYNDKLDISRQNIATAAYGNAYINIPSVQQQLQKLIPNNVISIDVRALKNVEATSFTAIFNLTQIGATAEETNSLANERIANVRAELARKGIPEKDIIVDVISFVPVYDIEVEKKIFSTKYNEVPKGFKLQQNLHIRFSKTRTFENILTACAKNEIYNLVKVDYFIEDIAAVYKELQKELLTLISEKKTYYKALGFDLSTYDARIADNKFCFFPKDFYQSYQAYNSISFEALKKPKNVTKAEKETSFYYQPLSYQDFDIVLNASILEPVIQIGMNISLQFTPIPEEKKQEPITKTEIKNKYYVISPDGNIDVKELKTN
jgi:uncharacterized protein YggE